MKMKKILAGVAASALAVKAMAASASAVNIADYFEKNAEGNHGAALYLIANDGKAQWAVDAGVDITTVYGVKFYVTFDAADVADEATWLGGAVVANSNSTGWKQVEWGRVDKEIIADLENGTVTWQNGAPIFAADDEYAQLWLVDWSTKKLSVDNIEVLDKDGNVITGNDAAETTEAETEAVTEAETEAATEAETEAATEAETEAATEAETEAASEAAPAETTAAPNGDTTNTPATDKGNADTGIEGVAVVAAIAVLAGGAVVIAKKRK